MTGRSVRCVAVLLLALVGQTLSETKVRICLSAALRRLPARHITFCDSTKFARTDLYVALRQMAHRLRSAVSAVLRLAVGLPIAQQLLNAPLRCCSTVSSSTRTAPVARSQVTSCQLFRTISITVQATAPPRQKTWRKSTGHMLALRYPSMSTVSRQTPM